MDKSFCIIIVPITYFVENSGSQLLEGTESVYA